MVNVVSSLLSYTTFLVYVVASDFKNKCESFNGIYYEYKCFTYINSITKSWDNAMIHCDGLIPGYNGHLAHVADSRVLAVLKDLARPIPTGYAGNWHLTLSGYIGAVYDSAVGLPTTKEYKNVKFAVKGLTVLSSIPVTDLYLLSLERENDPVQEQADFALALYNVYEVDKMNWGLVSYTKSHTSYFFCQTNEYNKRGFAIANDGDGRRLVVNTPMANVTATQSIGCLNHCKLEPLCLGYNFNSKLEICEFTAWRSFDALERYLYDADWKHFERF